MKRPPLADWMKPGHISEQQPVHEVYIYTKRKKWEGVRAERDIDFAREFVDVKCTPYNIPAVIITRTTTTTTNASEER